LRYEKNINEESNEKKQWHETLFENYRENAARKSAILAIPGMLPVMQSNINQIKGNGYE